MRQGLLRLLLISSAIACIGSLAEALPSGERLSRPALLGPYHQEMSLRQTFDSLSATAHRSQLELLTENVPAWVARWRAVAQARSTIDIRYFIFSQDLFGLALLGHLVEKARQGVRVRVQLDTQGMMMSTRPYGLDCMPFLAGTSNASVRVYRSLARRISEALVLWEPTLAVASDHDKIIMVDGHLSVVGGRNIEAKYFAHPKDLAEAFRDMDLLVEGAGIASVLTEIFEKTYDGENVAALTASSGEHSSRCAAASAAAYQSMDRWIRGVPLAAEASELIAGQDSSWESELQRFPRLQGAAMRQPSGAGVAAPTRILDSKPRAGSDADAVTQGLNRLFEAASRQIVMESPYLVLTESAQAMLQKAGRRNVEMTLLTNSPRSSDNALSQLYFGEQWPRLLATVPQLRLFAGGTTHNVHSKVVVFDEQVVVLGSYNLDPFSMLISGEVMVAVWSHELAARIAAETRTMIARGAPQVYEYTIDRDAAGQPVHTHQGDVAIKFGPADHIQAQQGSVYGFRWVMLRAIPWLAGLPRFF